MSQQEELLEVTDDKGRVISLAPRSQIHGNPSLIHRVVHVLVFNNKGELLLQKRSINKDVAPGKWDTSVGGHVNPKEELIDAAKREMKEELGIERYELDFLYSYTHSNYYETELVHTYSCNYNDNIMFDKYEIDKVKIWSIKEIEDAIGRKIFSDNFEHEFSLYMKNNKKNTA
ncbi:MAG: NUDIX domain-containing protein [Nitrospiraceae bacterium]|nr:NUDIX domain-containing protein [Nitrospiraceae bacterium]